MLRTLMAFGANRAKRLSIINCLASFGAKVLSIVNYQLSIALRPLALRDNYFPRKVKDFFPTDQISAPENVSLPLK